MSVSVNSIVMALGTLTAGLALAEKALDAPYHVHTVRVGGSRETLEAYMLGFRGVFGADVGVLFVHTGGLPITFAYSEEILERLGDTAHPD